MMKLNGFIFIALLIVASSANSYLGIFAQAPPTIQQALEAKGVQTSLPSLRESLQDPRPEVRGLAAAMLAEKKDKDSIPAIRQAITKATTVLERENLAQALLTLGDSQGNTAMREVCNDDRAPQDLRLIAANQLREVGDNRCIGSVVAILASTTDSSVRQSALHLVRRERSMSSSLISDLQVGLERALNDEIPLNRQFASQCILQFKISSAKDALRRAISNEKDSTTRTQMQTDLNKLEQ